MGDIDGRKTLSERAWEWTPGSQPKRPLRDLDLVRLTKDLDCPGGRINQGTQGTVLQVFDGGRAYQVEFEGPYPVPETVPGEVLELDAQPAQG